jgi:hypothetical protein
MQVTRLNQTENEKIVDLNRALSFDLFSYAMVQPI